MVGFAVGLLIFIALKSVPGLHKYDVPPLAFKVVGEPVHIATSGPASGTGSGFTVTRMPSVELPQAFVTVTVYEIVVVGLATGLEILVALKFVAGLHA